MFFFAGVGKTRLVIRYIKNTLHRSESEVPTIAVSFFTCNIFLDEVKIKLQVRILAAYVTVSAHNSFRAWANEIGS